MVSMTRWRQSPTFDPGNPNQRTRTAFSFGPPRNGGFQNVWFDPIPVGDSVGYFDSAAGVIPGSGVSGALGAVSSTTWWVVGGIALGALAGGLLAWKRG